MRPTWADVDLTAIRDNVAELKDMMKLILEGIEEDKP